MFLFRLNILLEMKCRSEQRQMDRKMCENESVRQKESSLCLPIYFYYTLSECYSPIQTTVSDLIKLSHGQGWCKLFLAFIGNFTI